MAVARNRTRRAAPGRRQTATGAPVGPGPEGYGPSTEGPGGRWPRRRALRRPVARLAGAALALTLTAACAGGSAAGEAGNSRKTTLTWQAAPFGDRTDDARKYLVRAFEQAHPEIDVKVVSAPTNVDTNRAGLTTQIMGQSSTPDVFNGDVAWSAQFAAAGLVLPIGEHLPKRFWDRFDDATVEGASYRGTVYGVPLTLDQAFLYYRKDLLAEHDLPVPRTWEEVARQSKVLQRAGEVKYGLASQGASYEGLTAVATEYLEAAGGRLVRADGQRSGVGGESGRKALGFMRKQIASGVSPKATATFQEPQSLEAFTGGDAAFLRNWAYAYETADAKESGISGKVGVTALPTFAGHRNHASTVGGWNVYINPHTQKQRAALQFVTWLTSPATQRMMAKRSSTIPTVDAVRDSAAVRRLSPVLRASSGNDLVSRPTTSPYYPQISQATYGRVNSLLSGGGSASSTATGLAAEIEAALAGRRL